MEHFVAYHSVRKMGYALDSSDRLRHFSDKPVGLLERAVGHLVWVVQGRPEGSRTAYSLFGAYIATGVEPDAAASGRHAVVGERQIDFDPPMPLNDLDWFGALRDSQGNFSQGFNRIDNELVVRALKALGPGNSQSLPAPDIDHLLCGIEGEARHASHLRRERDRGLMEAKKEAVLKAGGNLACEACGFDFAAAYGELGRGFCEVHHLVPLSSAIGPVVTTADELAILCSNCHRMMHRADPMPTVTELADLIRHIARR